MSVKLTLLTPILILSAGPALAAPHARAARMFGEQVALAEWRKAPNRKACAPLALASNGGVAAKVRSANFGGGWGVAFDTPRMRSAYGFAGSGLLPEDGASQADKRIELARQWPYTRELGRPGGLPEASLAGYGLEGAGRYSDANPSGSSEQSIAYVRIAGQKCLYDVWSRVSRAHLETLLDSLRIVGKH
jgi:hypothetical protein